ncbi:MAG: nitroreductase [Leptospiraceae bacterium]|jgi:nitroreductase|nr:nitroreductase [Leptospiraceae bacterium]MCZ8347436.1 nitroreductase [Leptospiraceae bacterium]
MEEFLDITKPANSVSEALTTRHSIREFDSRPIPENILHDIINKSLRAPSWKNAQPWKIHIVSGNQRNLIAEKLSEAAKSGQPNPATPWLESYPSDAKKRMFDLGMKIYGVAGIERKDKNARDEFMLRNFSFFGAPTAIFISSTFDLNFFIGIDLGCFLQSVLLMAREHGLGTCAQAALGAFPDVVTSQLSIPKEEKIVLGISLGYPKSESQLNSYHTPREAMENLVRFYN